MNISPEDQNVSTWLLSSKQEQMSTQTPPIWFSKRLLVTIMTFLCYVNAAVLSSNVNIAIVDMASNKSFTKGDIVITKPPEFKWDSTTEGVILSAFSYGELLSFLGSFFVSALGGSRSCALAVFIMGITTILQPTTLYCSIYLFLVCRFLTGIFRSFYYISTAEIYARWIPIKERCTLVSHSINGNNVGYTISTPILGLVAYIWGWKMIFYSTGTASIILSILFFVLVKNYPFQDKGISDKELVYIHNGTSTTKLSKVIHPYKDIFLSTPIWALFILQFAISWVPTIMNAYFPIYVKDLTHRSTHQVGLIAALPTAAQIIMFPVAGILLNYCKMRTNLTTTQIHKILLSISLIISSILFLAIVHFSEFTISLVIFVLIQLLVSPVHLVVELIIVGIAPNDTSVVAGIGTISQAVSCIISRLITGFMITHHSLQEWNNCFLLMAVVLLFGAIIFVLFGSSEPQWWSLRHHDEDRRSEKR